MRIEKVNGVYKIIDSKNKEAYQQRESKHNNDFSSILKRQMNKDKIVLKKDEEER